MIKAWVKETPKKLTIVQEKIQKEWGIVASKDTIKRVLKCRVRASQTLLTKGL